MADIIERLAEAIACTEQGDSIGSLVLRDAAAAIAELRGQLASYAPEDPREARFRQFGIPRTALETV